MSLQDKYDYPDIELISQVENITKKMESLLEFYDEALYLLSCELAQIAEEGAILKLKNGDKLFLQKKVCGKKGCRFCPHNLVWELGRYIKTKDGGEMIKWKHKQYAIDKVGWARVKNLSEEDQKRYYQVRDQVLKNLKKRKAVRKEKKEYMELIKKIKLSFKFIAKELSDFYYGSPEGM